MRFVKLTALTGLFLMMVAVAAVPATAQGPAVVAYSVRSSSREASVRFQFQDGGALEVALRNGDVLVNGERAGGYLPGGALDTQWRQFLAWAGGAGADQAVAAARAWTPEGVTGEEARALGAIRARLAGLAAAPGVEPPPAPPAPDIEAAVAAAAAAADEARALRDEIRSSVRSDVRESLRDLSRQRERPRAAARFTTPVEVVFNGLLGLGGAFLALTAIAFGASFFAGRQLDVVADTVATSFARSFFVGLFAQPLVLPALGAVIAGLTLTVIGILVVPVAIVAFVVALIAALIGGYLAVARVAGSAWMKRRRGDHGAEGFGHLRSVAYGLAILLAVWLPAAVLGWVPVAGSILTWTAAVCTWGLMTAGFGATLLTRGGVRTTFGRRFHPPALPPATLFEAPGPEISTSEWLSGRR